MSFNGEILKYYREYQNRTISNIADVLDVDEEVIENLENIKGTVTDEQHKLSIRYCRLLHIGSYTPYMKNYKQPEHIRKFGVIENVGYYTAYARKDNEVIEFDISKEDVVNLVHDLVNVLADAYK